MKLFAEVISGEKLMDRWRMSDIQLLFMFLNHKLKIVWREFAQKGWQDYNNSFANMFEYLDDIFKKKEDVCAYVLVSRRFRIGKEIS